MVYLSEKKTCKEASLRKAMKYPEIGGISKNGTQYAKQNS